jgi:hypothetical protein
MATVFRESLKESKETIIGRVTWERTEEEEEDRR